MHGRNTLTVMKLTRITPVRLSDEDHREILAVADHLGLTPSETTRRSLRIALPMLKEIELPGGRRSEVRQEQRR